MSSVFLYRHLATDDCDSSIWSGACEGAADKTGSDRYLCEVCGVIQGLDHEVRHEGFPHVSGDYANLC